MTSRSSTTSPTVRVAIDVAKLTHQVLVELPNGKRRVIRVANTRAELDRLVTTLRALDHPCEVAFGFDTYLYLQRTQPLGFRPAREFGGPRRSCAGYGHLYRNALTDGPSEQPVNRQSGRLAKNVP